MQDAAGEARELETRARRLHVWAAMASITGPIRKRSQKTARIIRRSNRGIATAGYMQDVAIGAHATKTRGRGGLIGRKGTASVRLTNNRVSRTAARERGGQAAGRDAGADAEVGHIGILTLQMV